MDARRVLPGPRLSPLLGRQYQLWRFRRDPLGYVQHLTKRYGALATLDPSHPRLVFVSGAAATRQLLAEAEHVQMLQAHELQRAPLRLTALLWSAPPPLVLPEAALPALTAITLEQVEGLLDRWGIGQVIDVAYVLPRLMRRIVLALLLGPTAPQDAHLEAILDRVGTGDVPPTHAIQALAGLLQRRSAPEWPDTDPAHVLVRAAPGQAATLLWRLITAHERLGLLLGWCLLLLSQHPRVLEEAEHEVEHVFGRQPPALEALAALPRLEHIMRETLRLLPPLALGARITRREVTLAGYRLPAETLLFYSPLGTQRDAAYIAPYHFRPERWRYLEPTPELFHPFGLGPDLWDAAPWAMVAAKLILARVLQRYRLAFAPGARIDWARGPMLQPRTGLPLIIGARHRPLIRRTPSGAIRTLIALP
ncbi:cytochrome P450 [Kallotenue papyrolyticum]|uniref:cytochrome P450 n=1 Tax=Kallotenue papyrolyticum TaxID=1325125 RepID=UPI000492B955|nr:cytochrome P450 [Kallotenue papyrolyticum]